MGCGGDVNVSIDHKYLKVGRVMTKTSDAAPEVMPEMDKWGFTIKPLISDDECIRRCLSNIPCGIERKQVERLLRERPWVQ